MPVIQSLKQIDHVIKYDERRNQDGPLVILHDQVVPLKFPNLIRVGLDAVVSIAEDRIRNIDDQKHGIPSVHQNFLLDRDQ